jgi:serine/threonine-protein kinase
LTTPAVSEGEYDHWSPHPLPDGRGILFTVAPSATPNLDDLRIAVFDSRTRKTRTILTGASSARYVPTGHIIYAARGTLLAARFDLERLEIVGEGVQVVEQVVTKLVSGEVSVGVSLNGTLAYLYGVGAGSQRSLAWIDRDGREEPIVAPMRGYVYPSLSPDGTRVALDIRDQENDIWIWDLNRRILTRLTNDSGLTRGVVWSPDGKHIAFSTTQRDNRGTLYWQSADGTGPPERLIERTRPPIPSGFSPDGKFLLFHEPDSPPFDTYALNLADRKVQPLLTSPKFSQGAGQVSPDGRWLAYQSNESGSFEIYVRPFPGVDRARTQVSTGGGTRPVWSPTKKELFYIAPPSTIMAVPVDLAAPSFSPRNPVVAVKGNFFMQLLSLPPYTVSPDGKRFIVIKPDLSSTPAKLVLALNWLDELKRLVP